MITLTEFLQTSGFAQRCQSRWPRAFTVLLEQQAFDDAAADVIESWLEQNPVDDAWEDLRRRRQLHCLRIAWRDISGQADFSTTCRELSMLAEHCMEQALARASEIIRGKFGELLSSDDETDSFAVIALGKLGGRELNFSSDVDVMFVYRGTGKSNGRRKLDAGDYFVRLAREWVGLLDRVTEHGHVYRVDTRLRPYGNSGALVWRLAALEDYYQNEGRDWERFALLKARPVAGQRALGEEFLQRLRPFIYRRYLDYGLFEGVRNIHSEIEREGQRKGRREHLKLGPGGIREVEFLVQSHQVVRGGQETRIRQTTTLNALRACHASGIIARHEYDSLTAAYIFLRNAENRLQMLEDQQTHELPRDPADQQRLAALMNQEWASFHQQLRAHQQQVSHYFGQLFQEPPAAKPRWRELITNELSDEEAQALLGKAGFDGARAWQLLRDNQQKLARQALSIEARRRIEQFLPRLLEEIIQLKPDTTLLDHCLDLLNAVARRSAYLSLLLENPQALRRMVDLFARSPAVVAWVMKQPSLLDDLIDPSLSHDLPDAATMHTQLQHRLRHVDDQERRLDTLLRAQQTKRLHIAINQLTGQFDPLRAQVFLGAVAQATLKAVLAEQLDNTAQTDHCGLAIIAYGALGASEMRYGSDLDLVFLYEPERLPERSATRITRRIIHWLSTTTAAGRLYEIDTRLRPNGRSGLLVSSVHAFAEYQQNKAWTWELQALTRARAMTGDQSIATCFENIRQQTLCRQRDDATLRQELLDMRQKMRAAMGARNPMKHGDGGLVDLQFLIQYWQLRWAAQYPSIIQPRHSCDILRALDEERLISHDEARLLAKALVELTHARQWEELTDIQSNINESVIEQSRQNIRQSYCRYFQQT